MINNSIILPSISVDNNLSLSQCSLPRDVIPKILYCLPVKALLKVCTLCQPLKALADDSFYWTDFAKRIKSEKQTKVDVIQKIKDLILATKNENPELAMLAHISLSNVEFSTLDEAYKSAEAFSDYNKCAPLALAYLDKGLLVSAAHIMEQMVPGVSRGEIAFGFIKLYLEQNNLEKALPMLPYNTNVGGYGSESEVDHALRLFIRKAKQAGAIDIALKALEANSRLIFWKPCVRDFNDFLLERGELEKSKQLQQLYPKAFEPNKTPIDQLYTVKYYAHNGHVEKAIEKALSASDVFLKVVALNDIEVIVNSHYHQPDRQEKMDRLALLLTDYRNSLHESRKLNNDS